MIKRYNSYLRFENGNSYAQIEEHPQGEYVRVEDLEAWFIRKSLEYPGTDGNRSFISGYLCCIGDLEKDLDIKGGYFK